LNFLKSIISPIKKLPPGTFNYLSPPEDPRNYRLHLRIEVDGSGMLLLNGSTILHLNQTAAEFAYYLIQNKPAEETARIIKNRYNIDFNEALDDYQNFIDRIKVLLSTPDLDPVTFLDFDRRNPYTGPISAPYRLDCALSYQTRAGDSPTYAPIDRVTQELTTEQWKKVIKKAWDAGIPHIVFTGGEPTLREDLPELLSYAEEYGQVTGIITDGLIFENQLHLANMLATGLDYILMILRPENPVSWISLENLLSADIYIAVHLTITPTNEIETRELINKLRDSGVKAISLSASNPEIDQILIELHHFTSELNLELVWNLPVPYSELNPIAFESQQALEGAGRAWLYIEPDGDVLPSQGNYQELGNFLSDDWEGIWKNSIQSRK
jgi:hypothetical protein